MKWKTLGNQLKTVTFVAQVSEFYILFIKVGYYPLLLLTCTNI